MARMHGRWGHYVRPGATDPKRYGSGSGTAQAKPAKRRKSARRCRKGKSGEDAVRPDTRCVWERDGRMAYMCGAEEWDATVAHALRGLPEASVDWVKGGAKLRWRLQDLGFLSAQEFVRWCSSQRKR